MIGWLLEEHESLSNHGFVCHVPAVWIALVSYFGVEEVWYVLDCDDIDIGIDVDVVLMSAMHPNLAAIKWLGGCNLLDPLLHGYVVAVWIVGLGVVCCGPLIWVGWMSMCLRIRLKLASVHDVCL